MTGTDPQRQTPLPRWYWITLNVGTSYVPLAAVLVGLLLHTIGWRMVIQLGQSQLPVGHAIGFCGLGFALLTWAVLGAVAYVHDTWGNNLRRHGKNQC